MRWAFGLVALLVAMVVALTLSSRQAERSVRAVNQPIGSLKENVEPEAFDPVAATALADRLEALADESALPLDELRQAVVTTAAWAAGSQPGSAPYRAAVKLRGAADALLSSGEDSDDPRRDTARRLVREGREALASPLAQPGGPTGAIRDQLENLQYSRREQIEGAERAEE
jgi:hypothetical protein